MGYVVNNVVKMQWDESMFLTKKKGSVFYFAGHDYETPNGTVTVFFNTETAFVWGEKDDLWNGADLIDWAKAEMDGSFPIQYDIYHPIIECGEDTCTESALEEFGLTEFKEDIEARFQDLEPYGKFHDKPIG